MGKKICLWSTPRNVSTALMYSFAQREDTQVFDEPLYAHYLKLSGVKHPGREDVLISQENDGNKVIEEILSRASNKIEFYKLMTHFLIDLDYDFFRKVTNILLIRDPREVIYSYSKIIPAPSISDIGIIKQYKLYKYLEKSNIATILLDSKELLKNPSLVLEKLCDYINIPFKPCMLHWNKGPIKEDGCWARYWYKDVHESTKFNKYIARDIELNNKNIFLAKECEWYYNFLLSKSIKT